MTEAPPASVAPRQGRRRPRVALPTQAELDALSVEKRLELLDKQRDRRHQWFNSLGILFSVIFTAAGLIATALTLRTAQDQLRVAQEGQITDRYIRTMEQLGSDEHDVRVGAVYALERIATDSLRDRRTVVEVLAAFVRENDPAPTVSDDKLTCGPRTDVLAALAVLGRLPYTPSQRPVIDLPAIRVPCSVLAGVDLSGANLGSADLRRSHLQGANLSDANLYGANLSDAAMDRVNLTAANLIDAKLPHASLHSARLRNADLHNADLSGAILSEADLSGASLVGGKITRAYLSYADLSGAQLTGLDLTGVQLDGADLSGADLEGVRGMTVDEIKRVAKTDAKTKF